MKYTSLPVEIEAVQFTGENWNEMHEFTGHRILEGLTESDGRQAYADIFNEIGTYLSDVVTVAVRDDLPAAAELWVEANQCHLPLVVGEWVAKDSLGFYPIKNEVFIKKYVLSEDAPMMKRGWDKDNIPQLDVFSDLVRMLGRIRMALIMTRPIDEADAICDRIATIIAEHRVLMKDRLTYDEDTIVKVRMGIEETLEQWGIIPNVDFITEMVGRIQNQGIKFREVPRG